MKFCHPFKPSVLYPAPARYLEPPTILPKTLTKAPAVEAPKPKKALPYFSSTP